MTRPTGIAIGIMRCVRQGSSEKSGKIQLAKNVLAHTLFVRLTTHHHTHHHYIIDEKNKANT